MGSGLLSIHYWKKIKVVSKSPKKILHREYSLLLAASKVAYDNYLQSGKRFAYAREIKSVNDKILKLLQTYKLVYKIAKHSTIDEFILHLETWSQCWTHHEIENNPEADSVFAFESPFRFPHKAASEIKLILKKNSE